MKLDFIGVGFGRSGSNWLAHCLYEHPEISIPKFNLHTEINYFPGEYEIMGLKNYENKFKNCDFNKKVGELSTLIIFQKRSAKLLKSLFPKTKIIIYKRKEKDRARSSKNVADNYDLMKSGEMSGNLVTEINQDDYIRPYRKEFGKNLHLFNMDNKNKQLELNKLFRFLEIANFTPSFTNKRLNSSYTDKERKKVVKSKYPLVRKSINLLKPRIRKHKKIFYFFKRNLKMDYYFQAINHAI